MKKVKIYDCFLFFQEIELLKLRLDYLYDHVDFFIIVESAQTFSGREKEFEFQKIKDSITKFEDKTHCLDALGLGPFNFSKTCHGRSFENEATL